MASRTRTVGRAPETQRMKKFMIQDKSCVILPTFAQKVRMQIHGFHGQLTCVRSRQRATTCRWVAFFSERQA